jgi:MFS family permease
VPFVIQGVIVMLAVIPSFYLVKETLNRTPAGQADGASAPRRGLKKQDLRTPPILQVFVVQFLANVTRGGIFGGGVIMIYASFQYDMSTGAIGALRSSMALFGIMVTFGAGYVMDKYGRKYTIVPGLILSGLAMVFLALTDFLDMPIEIFIGAFIAIHLAVSIISGNMQTLSTDVAPAHARGAFFGVSRQIAQVGSLSSPVSFTILVQMLSYGVAFSFLASTALLGGVIMLFLIPETLVKEDATPATPDGSTEATPAPERPPA